MRRWLRQDLVLSRTIRVFLGFTATGSVWSISLAWLCSLFIYPLLHPWYFDLLTASIFRPYN
jgi:hypothetical protein